jgi:hypothetical protein
LTTDTRITLSHGVIIIVLYSLNSLILAIAYNFAMNFVVTGLTLAGAALPQIVVASDCRDSDPNELTPEFADLSKNPLPAYLRWFFAAGLSVGTMSMGIPINLLLIQSRATITS